MNYFGARYYDSDLGRWTGVDPLADKFPGYSPYNYVLNNPLKIVDPNGMDTLYFNNQGNYLSDQTKKGDGDHVGFYTDGDGNLVSFNFNDQSDAASILSSTTGNHIGNADELKIYGISIGENNVGEALVVMNTALGQNNPVVYPLIESQPFGNMDYTNQIGKIDPSIRSKVTVIDGKGYNNFDLGNYYWGRNMGRLGYSPGMAKFAAQTYERVFRKRNDHPTDQRAIGHGARKK